jgi:hypothetical protein
LTFLQIQEIFLVILNTFVMSISGRPQLFGQSSASASASAQTNFGFGGGNPINVPSSDCRSTEVSPGRFKVLCGSSGPTISNEHILWLQGGDGAGQILDIEIPNYKIQELIKAGFKTSTVDGAQINVLLKRPETLVDAQVDVPKVIGGAPKVNIQYEPVQNQKIHFPNDQRYSTLTGPIEPPLLQQAPSAERNIDVRLG